MTAHSGIEDPVGVEGTDIDRERAFSTAARYMKNRIGAFLNLPLAIVNRMALERQLGRIGTMDGATDASLAFERESDGPPDGGRSAPVSLRPPCRPFRHPPAPGG